MSISDRLQELGITVPEAPKAAGMYVPFKQSGNVIYLSGHLPLVDGTLVSTGKVGAEATVEDGQAAARACAINMLASLQAATGDLERITSVVKLTAFVASAAGFNQQPAVVNAASELFLQVFGEAGHHTRSAVGTNELPLDATVEIEGIFEVR